MSDLCPRAYREFLCLFCGRKTYGSGGGETEYCHICYHRFIKQLQAKIKTMKSTIQQLIWIAERADTDDSEDTTIELARIESEVKE